MNQKYRDEIKKMLCKNNGIKLIEVSYELAPGDIETHIRIEAEKMGIFSNNFNIPQSSPLVYNQPPALYSQITQTIETPQTPQPPQENEEKDKAQKKPRKPRKKKQED